MVKSCHHVKVIINPISGSGRGLRQGIALIRYLQKQGVRIETAITQKAGDAEHEACRCSTPIIVVGGDGTVNEIINGLGGRKVPLMIFPAGTANLLSREYKLPRGRADVYSLIQSGESRLLDVGHLYGTVNRRFLSVAGIGFDGEVTRLMKKVRRGGIRLYSYFFPLWQTLKNYSLSPFFLTIDDQTVIIEATTVIIGNIRHYGGSFSITHRARADDGWLDICVFPGRTKRDYFRYLVGIIFCRPAIFSDVAYYRGKKIEIRTPNPVPVEVDGDFMGYTSFTPLTCEIVPGSVSMVFLSPKVPLKHLAVRKNRKGRKKK